MSLPTLQVSPQPGVGVAEEGVVAILEILQTNSEMWISILSEFLKKFLDKGLGFLGKKTPNLCSWNKYLVCIKLNYVLTIKFSFKK
jgi:hypothetical protein